MKKILACLVLAGGMGAVSLIEAPLAAQPAKKGETKKADEKTGTVTVAAGKDGKFRFQVRSAEDKYIAGSGAYATEKEALAGVEELKKVLASAKPTVEKGKMEEEKTEDKKKKTDK